MSRPQQPISGGALTVVVIDTPAGAFTARFSERGLAQLDFPGGPRLGTDGAAEARPAGSMARWIGLTQAVLLAILAGERPAEFPPLDVSVGTAFQRRVWSALRKIVPGRTRSYGALAAALGSPRAARAVGSACGANPIPLLIPCHRVLAANGHLGGFSGGLEWKRRLLKAEGWVGSK